MGEKDDEKTKKKKGSSSKGYPNRAETGGIPDPETLREQWSYAKRQYSRWYSSAWGTAILAGLSFYALGWFLKGSNPLPSSLSNNNNNNNNNDSNGSGVKKGDGSE